ncbi:MAG TPA: hypothetical protein VLI55_07465 [Bryobacteraceae bacterium]|nr:hypothetical protein [Bryobacteraceae bacterium]
MTISGNRILFLTFADEAEANSYYLYHGVSYPGTVIKSFEVPASLLDYVIENSVPPRLARSYPAAALHVDRTVAPNQFGFRANWFPILENEIVPGSLRGAIIIH